MLKRSQFVLISFGIGILMWLALQTPLLRPLKISAWNFWVQSIARIFQIHDFTVSNDIQDNLNRLQIENARLKAELTDYSKLREQLGNLSYEQMRVIPALVTMKPDDLFQTEWVLNKGAKDGVIPNAPVIVKGTMLAGFITDVYENSSVCRLALDPAVSIPAVIENEGGDKGLAIGQSYTAITINTIKRDANIQPGQIVVTAGRDITPLGLVIGKIKTVRNEENEAYQEARLELMYTPDDIEAASILVNP